MDFDLDTLVVDVADDVAAEDRPALALEALRRWITELEQSGTLERSADPTLAALLRWNSGEIVNLDKYPPEERRPRFVHIVLGILAGDMSQHAAELARRLFRGEYWKGPNQFRADPIEYAISELTEAQKARAYYPELEPEPLSKLDEKMSVIYGYYVIPPPLPPQAEGERSPA